MIALCIRRLSIENGIPLITDPEVAIETLRQVLKDVERGTFQYKIADPSEPWNLRLHFLDMVRQHGGFANHHAHFDKAYLITHDNLRLSQVDMTLPIDLQPVFRDGGCVLLADFTRSSEVNAWISTPSRLTLGWSNGNDAGADA